MKKFVRIFLLFLLSCAFLFALMEIYARRIPNSYKYKDEWVKKNGAGIKTMILGNSTTNTAIMPSMIDSCFSMANSSQNLEYDYYILTKYSPYCPNLKTIILPIDYGNLFEPDYEDMPALRGYRGIYYKIYMNYPRHSNFSKWNFEIMNPVSLRNKYSQAIVNLCRKEKDFGYDYWGRTTEGRNYVQDEKDKDSTASKKYAKGDDSIWNNFVRNTEYVEGIARFCEEMDINLILLTCPKWEGVLNVLDNQRISKVYALGDDLSKKYRHITYRSFLKKDSLIHNSAYFRDVTHLTDEGARVFTQTLINSFDELR